MCYFLLQRLRVRRQAVTGSEAVCQSTERNELFQFHVQYTTIQKVCMDSDFTQFEIKKQFHSFIIRHLQKKCSGNLEKMRVFVRDTFHLNLWRYFLIQVQKEIQRYSIELWPHDVLISEDAISFWQLYEITLKPICHQY